MAGMPHDGVTPGPARSRHWHGKGTHERPGPAGPAARAAGAWLRRSRPQYPGEVPPGRYPARTPGGRHPGEQARGWITRRRSTPSRGPAPRARAPAEPRMSYARASPGVPGAARQPAEARRRPRAVIAGGPAPAAGPATGYGRRPSPGAPAPGPQTGAGTAGGVVTDGYGRAGAPDRSSPGYGRSRAAGQAPGYGAAPGAGRRDEVRPAGGAGRRGPRPQTGGPAQVRAPGATGRSPDADGTIPRVTRDADENRTDAAAGSRGRWAVTWPRRTFSRVRLAPARPRGPAGARPSLPRPAGRRRPGADAVTGPNLNPDAGPRPGWNRPEGTAPRSAPVPAATAGEPTTPGGGDAQRSAGTSARVRAPATGPAAGVRRHVRPGRLRLGRLRPRPVRADVARAGPRGPWRRDGLRCGPWI